MLASVATFAPIGVETQEVTVEVDVRRGLPAFTLVGLPDAAVREARERVRAALLNSELEFPLRRLTANLAPASLRKAGPSFDLALAVGVLAASGQLDPDRLGGLAVWGELSLAGDLRPCRGALAAAMGTREAGYHSLVVPVENAEEAALATGVEVLGVPTLGRLVDLLQDRWRPEPLPTVHAGRARPGEAPALDLADVRGQGDAKRALEIAAAGGHNLLMVGPPGAGKTMLARRLPGILPPPTREEALEITRIHSVAGVGDGRLALERPFRAPHHTISAQGLVGGGAHPRPGEVTLAHRGVLFLDEITEFARPALESLRQPLEDGAIEITRGQVSLRFPARAMVVAACNPCSCGRQDAACRCNEVDRLRYERRLSRPVLERIDLVCEAASPGAAVLLDRAARDGERSAAVRERVICARERQAHRLAGTGALSNADMDGPQTRRHAPVPGAALARLSGSIEAGLSGRGHDRVSRLARTIADLGDRERISVDDFDEALGYRVGAGLGLAA